MKCTSSENSVVGLGIRETTNIFNTELYVEPDVNKDDSIHDSHAMSIIKTANDW